MKTELEAIDIERIVHGVIEQLAPLLKQKTKSNDNELMTVEEVARYLKVEPPYIYNKVHKREIPFQKCGKFPRFRKKFIDIWLQNPYSSELDNFNLRQK